MELKDGHRPSVTWNVVPQPGPPFSIETQRSERPIAKDHPAGRPLESSMLEQFPTQYFRVVLLQRPRQDGTWAQQEPCLCAPGDPHAPKMACGCSVQTRMTADLGCKRGISPRVFPSTESGDLAVRGKSQLSLFMAILFSSEASLEAG